ncbi:MAG: hypothetical protein E6J75_11340 [Deltaproteobacteria bacterium]|nr:MAG: hypothetical protein E6J75_11340 [Deltaproteobacteria bacterium]
MGGYLAFQVWGLVLVVAVADHGPAVLAGGFRRGALSVIWVLGLVLSQGTAAALAWRGWRRERAP